MVGGEQRGDIESGGAWYVNRKETAPGDKETWWW